MINPAKYISLNILNIWSFFSFLIYCCLLLIGKFNLFLPLPLKLFDFLWYYTIMFINGTIIFHFLWIIEIIIRRKKFYILPEVNITKPFKIIHGITFYIGWIFAIYVMVIGIPLLWFFYFTPEGRGIDLHAID